MTREDRKDFEILKEFVRKDIFGYDNGMKLPKSFTTKINKLALDNNKKMVYTYRMITYGFIINRNKISYALNTKQFQDENHKINYVIAIVSNSMNDVKQKFIQDEKQKNKKQNDIEQAKYLNENNLLIVEDRYKRKTQYVERDDDLWKI